MCPCHGGDDDTEAVAETSHCNDAGNQRHRRGVRAWLDDVRWRRVLRVTVGSVAIHVHWRDDVRVQQAEGGSESERQRRSN